MKRGELYRVERPGSNDPKRRRVFVVLSRQALIDSEFSTVICAPVFTNGEGLATQVGVGTAEGLKHESWIMADNLTSLPKAGLTHYVGTLSRTKSQQLDQALKIALALF